MSATSDSPTPAQQEALKEHGLATAAENVRNASLALRAYMRFHDEVAAVAIDMAERGDRTSLRLLNAMRDLQAQAGELYVEEEN